jgi:hypothetical protein
MLEENDRDRVADFVRTGRALAIEAIVTGRAQEPLPLGSALLR